MKKNIPITSLQHPLVKHMVKLRKEGSYRKDQGVLVLEGVKPILEVSSFVTKCFYTPSYCAFAEPLLAEKWEITDFVLEKMSGLSSPEGMLAEIRMPDFGQLDNSTQVLALDGINDPGNLGTLLRTALALGWETVFLLPGNCDPFNEKALRAARGAHFKLKLVEGSAETLKKWVETQNIQALVAQLKGLSPQAVPPSSSRLLVLGNEAHGPSKAIQQFCQAVSIPMPGEMESLNVSVAGGILLYLLSLSIDNLG